MDEATRQNVSLSWQPPLYNASLMYYTVVYRETRENGRLYPMVATNDTSLALSGFDEGTEHQFTVSGFFQGGVVGENVSLLVTTQEDGEGCAVGGGPLVIVCCWEWSTGDCVLWGVVHW